MNYTNYANYKDIITLPHQESKTRPKMSKQARAAQFAPFAALTGFDEIIDNVELRIEN